MSLERFKGNPGFEKMDNEIPPSNMGIYELKEGVKALPDPGDRVLIEGLVNDLEKSSKRYLWNVLSYRAADDVSKGIDEARRRNHDSLIHTLHPIVRNLGGRYLSWFNDNFMNGNNIDRKRVGQWALREAIDAIQGELIREQIEHEHEDETRDAA